MTGINVFKKYGTSKVAKISLTMFDPQQKNMVTLRITRDQLQNAVADYLCGQSMKILRVAMTGTKVNAGESETFYLVRKHIPNYEDRFGATARVAITDKYDAAIIRAHPQMHDDRLIETVMHGFEPFKDYELIVLHNDDSHGEKVIREVEALLYMQKNMNEVTNVALYARHFRILNEHTEALFDYLPKYH